MEKIITLEEKEEEIVTIEDNKDEEIVTFEEGVAGTTNYEDLNNRPFINEIEVIGRKSSKDYKLQDEMESLSNIEIEKLLSI